MSQRHFSLQYAEAQAQFSAMVSLGDQFNESGEGYDRSSGHCDEPAGHGLSS